MNERFQYTDYTILKRTGAIVGVRRSDGASIPIDPKNSDYIEALRICQGQTVAEDEQDYPVFYFDEQLGDYLGTSSSLNMYPYNHNTKVAPPTPVTGQIAVFNKVSGTWSLQADSVVRVRMRTLRTLVALGDPSATQAWFWQMIFVDSVIRNDALAQTQVRTLYNSLFP